MRIKPLSTLSARFFALRHGQSEANVLGIVSSDPAVSTKQHGLTPLGKVQARAAGKKLRSILSNPNTKNSNEYPPYCHIVSSDFLRARETASLVCEETGLDGSQVQLHKGLRERNFGELNGKSATQSYSKVWELDAFDSEHRTFHSESPNSVLNRVLGTIYEIDEQLKKKKENRTVVVFVSHGDTLQILQTAFEKIDVKSHRMITHLETAELRELVPQ